MQTRFTTESPRPVGSLRLLLESAFQIPEDLDAFCIDHFPSTAKQFSTGMTKTQKINVLLLRHDPHEILSVLIQSMPELPTEIPFVIHEANREWMLGADPCEELGSELLYLKRDNGKNLSRNDFRRSIILGGTLGFSLQVAKSLTDTVIEILRSLWKKLSSPHVNSLKSSLSKPSLSIAAFATGMAVGILTNHDPTGPSLAEVTWHQQNLNGYLESLLEQDINQFAMVYSNSQVPARSCVHYTAYSGFNNENVLAGPTIIHRQEQSAELGSINVSAHGSERENKNSVRSRIQPQLPLVQEEVTGRSSETRTDMARSLSPDNPQPIDPLDGNVVISLPDSIRHKYKCQTLVGCYQYCVSPMGTIDSVRTLQSIPEADEHILSLIKTWRFTNQSETRCDSKCITFSTESITCRNAQPKIDEEEKSQSNTKKGSRAQVQLPYLILDSICVEEIKKSWRRFSLRTDPDVGKLIFRIHLSDSGEVEKIDTIKGLSPDLNFRIRMTIRDNPACHFSPAKTTDGKAVPFVIDDFSINLER
jgi:hypothetical protein